MIIGVISDTHGRRKLMHEVADRLVSELGAEWIYHAGDDFSDAIELDHAGHKVRAVPGLWCMEYVGGRVPRHICDEVDGITVGMAHAEKDLTYVERSATVVITGHTHAARIERLGNHVYLNPGHLKGALDRGEQGSFATVAVDNGEVVLSIYELSGKLRQTAAFRRDELA